MTLLEMVEEMKHSPLDNYAGVPGLTSWLIGAGERGNVRLLECSRDHQEPIIPHSHRFDFLCRVLRGKVRNLIWEETDLMSHHDTYQATELTYGGEPGVYQRGSSGRASYRVLEEKYVAGDSYSMKADQIHSIFFSRGTRVLFFEGPTLSDTSVILEPVVHGRVVPTFDVKDWMFKRNWS